MPSADLLFPFFLASLAFSCVPGPGMLYAAARTLTLGRRAGWWSALGRSEEHTSELQSLMRISYAVFCLKKKQTKYMLELLPLINKSHAYIDIVIRMHSHKTPDK